jgi:hypothetical protein
MKKQTVDLDDDLRPEYDFDFTQGERGRYSKRLLAEGANVVVLEPEIAAAFPDSAAVNNALRSLLELARSAAKLPRARRRPSARSSAARVDE